MQLIKGGFSYRVKKELGSNSEIWERGYVDHRIRDLNDYERHVTYIRQNPVEAHLATAEEKYPYSSACAGFERDPCPQGLKPEILGASYGMAESHALPFSRETWAKECGRGAFGRARLKSRRTNRLWEGTTSVVP